MGVKSHKCYARLELLWPLLLVVVSKDDWTHRQVCRVRNALWSFAGSVAPRLCTFVRHSVASSERWLGWARSRLAFANGLVSCHGGTVSCHYARSNRETRVGNQKATMLPTSMTALRDVGQ